MAIDFFGCDLFDFIASRTGTNHTSIAVKFPDHRSEEIISALDLMEKDALIYWDAIDGYKRKG